MKSESNRAQASADGRDIALRCPRPRISGWRILANRAIHIPIAPLLRGADGAARRRYQRASGFHN